jgi:predicted metalloendopeptidase
MKSYVKEFVYPTKEGGTSERKLFVMRENATAMDGLELTYLDEATQKEVLEALKDHEVKDNFTKAESLIDNYKSEWGKAWRRYNKDKIIVPEAEQE